MPALPQTIACIAKRAPKGIGVVLVGHHFYRSHQNRDNVKAFDADTKTSEVVHAKAHRRHHLT